METNQEFLAICHKIINHEEYQKRKEFKHHGEESVYMHSMRVAYLTFRITKKLRLRTESAVIGALLHDFYTTPWQEKCEPKNLFKKHGFVHAKNSHDNAITHFDIHLDEISKDAIIKHMFPLNIKPPKYKESWIVTLSDKLISLEVLKNPKNYLKLLGLNNKTY